MNEYKFIIVFLSTLFIAGVFCAATFSNTKSKSEWKAISERSLNFPVTTVIPKYSKPQHSLMNKIRGNRINRLKRSAEKSATQLQTNLIKEYDTNANNSYLTSKVNNENYKEESLNMDSHEPKYLSWKLNLNVTSYENDPKKALNNNPSDNTNNPEIKSDKDYMGMSVYISGRGPQLHHAWGSVGDFIKSLFEKNTEKIISGEEVVSDINRNYINTIPINKKFDEQKKVLSSENSSEFVENSSELQTSKGKEGKFLLGFFGFGGQTTPANLTSPESDTENLNQSVTSEEHTLEQNTLPKNFSESQAFSDAVFTTDISRFDITEDSKNSTNTFEPQSLVSKSPLEGREHSLTETFGISEEINLTEDFLMNQTEQSQFIDDCFDCESESVTTTAEISFRVPNVPTVTEPLPVLRSEESTFTDAELERYCMALVNRLGKSLHMSSAFSDGLGSGDAEISNEMNTGNSALSNLNASQIDESIKSENFGFFANIFNAIAERFRSSTPTGEKMPGNSEDIDNEPQNSFQSPSSLVDASELRKSRVDNLDVTDNDSDDDEIGVRSGNSDPSNLPSIFDCEHFFRNKENTKMFAKPNLMDIMSDPNIRLEDFENATISPKLKEQQMQFLTDLLKTGMNQTSVPDTFAETNTPDISLLKGDSTTFSEKNTELDQEQVEGFRTQIKISQTFVVTDSQVPERKFSEHEASENLAPVSSVSAFTDEQTTESPDRSGKFFNGFFGFGSGERSIDPATAASVQERFFGVFAFGSGDSRMDVNDDQVDSAEFETANILSEFESDSPRDFGTTSEIQIHMVDEIISFGSGDGLLDGNEAANRMHDGLFEGSAVAEGRDFLLTTETIINNKCDDCFFDYERELVNLTVTTVFDCDDCADEYTVTIAPNVQCQGDCDDEFETMSTNGAHVDCQDDCADEFVNLKETIVENDCEDDCINEPEKKNTEDGICEDCDFNSIQVSNISFTSPPAFICSHDCDNEVMKGDIIINANSDNNKSDSDEDSRKDLNVICYKNCEQDVPLEQRNISKPADLDYEDATVDSTVSKRLPELMLEKDLSTDGLVEDSLGKDENIPTQLSVRQNTVLDTINPDRATGINFPIESEQRTTEKSSRFFGTIFLAGSGAGGLLDDGGQINLIEEEEHVPNLGVPRKGSRLDDDQIKIEEDLLEYIETKVQTSDNEPAVSIPFNSRRGARFDDAQYGNEADLLESERRAVTLEQSKSDTLKVSYDLTTVVSTGTNTDVPLRITRRRGRLDDELENPMENTILETKNNHILNVSSYSDIEFNESVTQSETESLPSSTPVSSIQDSLPKPTEPQQRLCTSSRECNQALNERCLDSRCDCGRAFVRHRETGICEAKVTLETTLKFPQEEFHKDLRNPDSMRYKEMKRKAEESLWLLLSEDPKLIANIAEIHVSGFSQGSVVINYTVVFATEKNESLAELVDQVNYELNEAFHDESLLNLIPLNAHNATLLDISNAADPCASSELNYCSNHAFCEQDDTNVGGFYCRCKEGYQDISNNKIYAGEICEEECFANYCGDHGVCQIKETVGRHCLCSGWYFGVKCEISGIIIIVGVSAVNVLLIVIVMVLLFFCKRRRRRSNGYGDRRRRHPSNLELGSSGFEGSSNLTDAIALEENVGIKTSKITAISSPVQKPELPVIKVTHPSISNSSISCAMDSTFEETPRPIYENYAEEAIARSTV